MYHLKSLDGIRGVAVFLVALFHFGLFPVGWVGVQIFFVLSGYLITSILLREKHRPFRDYVGRFYWRRSLRIFPLYFFFLVGVAVTYLTLGQPASFGTDWPYLVTYTTNFARLRETDVGASLVHLWSLAVEEQFYLLWPFLVFFLPVLAFKRTVLFIIAITPLIRWGLYVAFQGHDPDWIGRNVYSLPISQFDAFATGAAIALWRLEKLANAWKWLLAALMLTAVAGAGVLAHEHLLYKSAVKWTFGYSMFLLPASGFVWEYSLLNLLSGVVIIGAIQRMSVLRPLEWPPIVRIGTISYGIYVYHLPILAALQQLNIPNGWLPVCYLSATILVAEISFRFLETPFLRLKDRRAAKNELAGTGNAR